MSFQIPTRLAHINNITGGPLARRVDFHRVVGVKFKKCLAAGPLLPPPAPSLQTRPLHSALGFGKNLPSKCSRTAGQNTNRLGKKFSTAATLWKWVQAGASSSSSSSSSPSGSSAGLLLRRIAVGVLGVATAAAAVSVHTTSGQGKAMAAGPPPLDLNSAKGDWKETKGILLSLSVEERRSNYRTSDYVPLQSIPVVTSSTSDGSEEPHYPRNEKLDQKLSLYSGDITKLEIDAIVNAANNSLLGGGGVDGAIHRAAGPLLKKECATLNGCETGQAKITCGYGLPAKYVIHTVGPVAMGGVGEEERTRLRGCYRNSLEIATNNNVRSLAFPCISTGIYGYPPEQAVHEALATVRKYLDEHHDKVDRVIFCVFLPTDKELYLKNIPLYFPGASTGPPVKSKL